MAPGCSTCRIAYPRHPASPPGDVGSFGRAAGSIPGPRSEMKVRGLRLAAWSVLACAAGYAQIVHAHEFKLDSVINAFVRIEPGQAELVVRAPLYLFKSVKFPVTGAEIDVDNSAPAVERALAAIQKDIVLFENDRPLVPSHATGRLSLPS